jgi:hypothetical protein
LFSGPLIIADLRSIFVRLESGAIARHIEAKIQMAKKKRLPPQKACISCGKMIHARKGTCDYCGAEQPAGGASGKKKGGPKKKSGAKRKPATMRAATVSFKEVVTAADFVSSLGSIDKARQALDAAAGLAKKLG